MLSGVPHITSGDVVAGGGSVFIVQPLQDGYTLLRLESPTGARHRADVSPEHWSEVAYCGLPIQDVVVRCVPVRSYGTCQFTKLGHVSGTMSEKIALALRREMLVRRFEDGPPMRSNLTASTSSSGRRINAVRYA